MTFPLIVKSQSEHGSAGITRTSVVDTFAQLREQVQRMLSSYKGSVIAEQFINGPEYIVTVVGNETPHMLPILSVDFSAFSDYHDKIQSFDSKWIKGTVEHDQTPVVIPVLSDALRATIEKEVLAAYKAVKCRGYARFDLRERDGKVYIVDVNANSAIEFDNSFFRSHKIEGLGYAEALLRLCEYGIAS